MKTENFIARVRQERELQDRLWGFPHDVQHHPMEWCSIVAEYLGRYASRANDWPMDGGEEDMEDALVKIAAVCCAAYEVL
jgi:hypothetical protein